MFLTKQKSTSANKREDIRCVCVWFLSLFATNYKLYQCNIEFTSIHYIHSLNAHVRYIHFLQFSINFLHFHVFSTSLWNTKTISNDIWYLTSWFDYYLMLLSRFSFQRNFCGILVFIYTFMCEESTFMCALGAFWCDKIHSQSEIIKINLPKFAISNFDCTK